MIYNINNNMETKQLLHIIPCVSEFEGRIKEVNQEELDNAGFWYLHGDLADLFYFDKAIMTNCKTLGLLKPCIYDEYDKDSKLINKLYYNGELDCEVEGCDKPCVAFLYTTYEVNDKQWMQRGLICIKEDKQSCEYARRKMIQKAIIL